MGVGSPSEPPALSKYARRAMSWDGTTRTLTSWSHASKGLGIQQGTSVWVGLPKSGVVCLVTYSEAK